MERIDYADSDGCAIAFRTVGEGDRDLAFVPGFVSHLEILWEYPSAARLLERLSSFARVILWDKREQGLSDRTGRPPTIEQTRDDLRAVLDAAGSERTALMSVSEGGPAALLFAASHPNRTSALVLLNTYARLGWAEDHQHGLRPEVLERSIELMTSDWSRGTGAARVLAPSLAEDSQFLDYWSRLLRSGTSPTGIRELMGLYAVMDARHVLPAISAPTLVLHRVEDAAVPIEHGRDLAARLGAELVELEGRDHVFAVGDVDAIADSVEEFLTGQPPAERAERLLKTVVFTDIVGSTERAASLGDRRWRELLERHNAFVRATLSRYGGEEMNATGDGFFAAFDGPGRAVECAAAVVTGAAEHDLEIRAGVHTGECELIGDGLGGLAVHIGARVGALAGGGEVLVTGTVRDLVVGSELDFQARGEHELKGVPGSWRVFALSP